MSSFLYAINIGTLATWFSGAVFGVVGIVVPVTAEMIHHEEPATIPNSSVPSLFN